MKKTGLALIVISILFMGATASACIPGSKVLAEGAITLWAEKVSFKTAEGTTNMKAQKFFGQPFIALTDKGVFVIEALEIQLTNDQKNVVHTDYQVEKGSEVSIYRVKSNYMMDGGMTRGGPPALPAYDIDETIGCGSRN